MFFVTSNLRKVVLDPAFRTQLPEWNRIYEEIDRRVAANGETGQCVKCGILKGLSKKMRLDVTTNRDMAERVRAYFNVDHLDVAQRNAAGKLRVVRIATK